MLKTKMKTLTDKLNITKNDDNRALHLQNVINNQKTIIDGHNTDIDKFKN